MQFVSRVSFRFAKLRFGVVDCWVLLLSRLWELLRAVTVVSSISCCELCRETESAWRKHAGVVHWSLCTFSCWFFDVNICNVRVTVDYPRHGGLIADLSLGRLKQFKHNVMQCNVTRWSTMFIWCLTDEVVDSFIVYFVCVCVDIAAYWLLVVCIVFLDLLCLHGDHESYWFVTTATPVIYLYLLTYLLCHSTAVDNQLLLSPLIASYKDTRLHLRRMLWYDRTVVYYGCAVRRIGLTELLQTKVTTLTWCWYKHNTRIGSGTAYRETYTNAYVKYKYKCTAKTTLTKNHKSTQ